MKISVRYNGSQGYHCFTLDSVERDGITNTIGAYTDGSNLISAWLEEEVGSVLPLHRRRQGYRPPWMRTNAHDGHRFHIRDTTAAAAFRLRWC